MRPIARRLPAAAALTLVVAVLVSGASTDDETPLTLDDFPPLTEGVLTNRLFAVREHHLVGHGDAGFETRPPAAGAPQSPVGALRGRSSITCGGVAPPGG